MFANLAVPQADRKTANQEQSVENSRLSLAFLRIFEGFVPHESQKGLVREHRCLMRSMLFYAASVVVCRHPLMLFDRRLAGSPKQWCRVSALLSLEYQEANRMLMTGTNLLLSTNTSVVDQTLHQIQIARKSLVGFEYQILTLPRPSHTLLLFFSHSESVSIPISSRRFQSQLMATLLSAPFEPAKYAGCDLSISPLNSFWILELVR
mmetsp:Transcript_13186/g.25111  ORF Transcript_13186/g.25111 Transcript_13186/m.25111 type:complete len:207 (+) Transcript_13186:1060-1680(+)